ncbi:hypothetical protein HBH92_174520 [Parastagonospora nodorum]|nr:hypothetical protein HBH92_174520 [Parastagonospora nodorum]KAH4448139.1 hypothetical protein HBH93_050460 [Parastagonospora nodorum]KAH4460177.1 hypothetical protein HBH91_069580 [Parastagonospora nodorum]KAH4807891.1 hypothetical protein HBH61_128690 [Parastagonospora nodorum]KAH4850960.1 hypothetical protein HBH75_126170 [Parastagonospora nodorum]
MVSIVCHSTHSFRSLRCDDFVHCRKYRWMDKSGRHNYFLKQQLTCNASEHRLCYQIEISLSHKNATKGMREGSTPKGMLKSHRLRNSNG